MAEATSDASTPAMSPAKILEARKLLTIFISSLITFPDDSKPSHTKFSLPIDAVAVKTIPKEVAGIRRQYLKAIQANIAARKRYQELVERTSNCSKDANDDSGARDRLRTHLRLLQLRKRHQEVLITKHYFEKLTADSHVLDGQLDQLRQTRDREEDANGLQDRNGLGSDSAAHANSEALIRELEISVLQARHQLELEKTLLADAEARHEQVRPEADQPSAEARIHALSATKNELVEFLDDRLTRASMAEEQHANRDEIEDDRNLETLLAQISAQYEQYITARKRLLAASSRLSSEAPPPGPVADTSPQSSSLPPLPLSTLPFIESQILLLHHQSEATNAENAYLTKTLKQRRADALEALERLGDESHLLPAYPIMAREGKFRHAAAVFGSSGKGEEEDELVKRAEAWAFAAQEARQAEDEMVKERVGKGMKALEGAGEVLGEIEGLVGPGHDEDVRDGDLESRTIGRKSRSTARLKEIKQEPWHGVIGDVEVPEND